MAVGSGQPFIFSFTTLSFGQRVTKGWPKKAQGQSSLGTYAIKTARTPAEDCLGIYYSNWGPDSSKFDFQWGHEDCWECCLHRYASRGVILPDVQRLIENLRALGSSIIISVTILKALKPRP